MKRVTNPDILAQLNDEPSEGGLKKVTDENLLEQLNQNQPSSAQNESPSWARGLAKGLVKGGGMLGYSPEQVLRGMDKTSNVLGSLGSDPISQSALGFGDAFGAVPVNTANKLGGGNLPTLKNGEGELYDTSHMLGTMAGETAQYLGAGGAIKSLLKLGTVAPGLIGKGAEMVLNHPKLARIAGGGAYGGLTNPDDPVFGTAVGLGVGTAAEALPAVVGALSKPRETSKNILNYIKNQHSKASSMYEEIKNAAKDTGEIYKTELPMYGGAKKVYGQYKTIDQDVFKLDKKIAQAHDLFKNSPTYENAQSLQSALGKKLGNYQGKIISEADKANIDQLSEARNAIQNDMRSHLERVKPELAAKYREASDIYKSIINPRNLLKGYRNPTPKDVLTELSKVNEKTKFNPLSPELKDQFNKLKMDNWKKNAALIGTLGLANIPHASHTLEALIAGKLMGLKLPESAVENTHKVFKGLRIGANQLGNVAKATVPPYFGDVKNDY